MHIKKVWGFCLSCFLLFGCAASKDGNQSVSRQATDQQILDLRLEHVEKRLSLLEEDIGEIRSILESTNPKYKFKKERKAASLASADVSKNIQPTSRDVLASSKVAPKIIDPKIIDPKKTDPAKASRSSELASNNSKYPSLKKSIESENYINESNNKPLRKLDVLKSKTSSPATKEQQAKTANIESKSSLSSGIKISNESLKDNSLNSNTQTLASTIKSETTNKNKSTKNMADSSSNEDVKTKKIVEESSKSSSNKENLSSTKTDTTSNSLTEPSSLPITVSASTDGLSHSNVKKNSLSPKAGKSVYDEALRLFEQKKYNDSIKLFKDFISSYPKSKLVPNAYYWVGECYYSMGKYSEAIMEFREVISKYSKDPKAAASLLKTGYSYLNLNDSENATFYLNILLEDFPNSTPAKLAKERLKKL